MSNDLTLAARLQLDSQRWVQGLTKAQNKTRGFVSGVQREFGALRNFLGSTSGILASVGAGYGIANTIMRSAQTDQTLSRIKQTAGLTAKQVDTLRGSLHGMAEETGNSFGALMGGFGQLVAGGLGFDEALPTIAAINDAMRVTGSEAEVLAGALQSAQANFNFDLSKPGVALKLLDQMTVAGRAGVIEIEDLAGVFGTAANEARAAGLSFEQTLALIEGMGTATTKDRVGTLVASTLRIFTNANYMKAAQKATGIGFFDKKGDRRNPLDVIADIKTAYDKLGTDKDRFSFISKAFGKADLDSIKGIRQALDSDNLSKVLDIARDTERASGTIKRDINESMDNAVAQADVLRTTLATAGDEFAKPINSALSKSIKYLTGKKSEGGLELSGKELMGYGAAATLAAYAGGRVVKGALGKMLGGSASLGTGLVMGATLDKAGAATPVFVVGAAPGLFSGVGDAGGLIPAAAPKPGASKLKYLAALGIPALVGSSVLFDERNQNTPNGFNLDAFNAKQGGGDHGGFGWARRGGIAPLNLLADLIQGFKTKDESKLIVDVNVNDNLTTVRTRTVGRDFVNVRSGSSGPRTGRVMSDRGGGR